MDRANFALCKALLDQGRTVHLVAHAIDPELLANVNVKATMVARPLNSILLGERALAREGYRVASEVTRQGPGARVVVNGGNCPWPDINWVHQVHAFCGRFDDDAPIWFRAKNELVRRKARADEKRALSLAKLVISNSELTRRDLIASGVSADLIRTVLLGSDPAWTFPTAEERHQARRSFDLPPDAKVVSFVGALGHDQRKGFDTLLAAWRKLSLPHTHLLVAGGGRCLQRWRNEIRHADLANSVHLLGFTNRVTDVYAASDLLVSPVRYEPFGLNVQEAICRGVPAIVTETAGVAELYPDHLRRFLLPDANDSDRLAAMIQHWHSDPEIARRDFHALAQQVQARSWQTMAEEIISLAEASSPIAAGVCS